MTDEQDEITYSISQNELVKMALDGNEIRFRRKDAPPVTIRIDEEVGMFRDREILDRIKHIANRDEEILEQEDNDGS